MTGKRRTVLGRWALYAAVIIILVIPLWVHPIFLKKDTNPPMDTTKIRRDPPLTELPQQPPTLPLPFGCWREREREKRRERGGLLLGGGPPFRGGGAGDSIAEKRAHAFSGIDLRGTTEWTAMIAYVEGGGRVQYLEIVRRFGACQKCGTIWKRGAGQSHSATAPLWRGRRVRGGGRGRTRASGRFGN